MLGVRIIKRSIDILISVLAVILFSPFIAIIALLIKLTSKGPVLFTQRRIGKNNKEFTIYKFRTMRIDAPNVATHLLSNPEVFVTSIGKFLRKTSLDELPQLFNIVKGEMSIVGPRPALYNQEDLIELRTKCGVHTLVPGLTGWAQINGRDEVHNQDKVRLDYEYKEKQSIIFDFKIMFMTFFKVMKREGIKS